VDVILHVREFSKYIERECLRGFGGRNIGIYNSKEVFGKFEERVWRKR